jgi:N-acetylglutamate synthase-like GNAT family acetyltransferase
MAAAFHCNNRCRTSRVHVAEITDFKVISTQLDSGWEYFIAVSEGVPVGCTGLVPDVMNRKLMLSKIYVRQLARGKGAGNSLLSFSEKSAKPSVNS